ncbi:MAG TPA: hypothetical protein VM165_10410 [Planctomycetaceae bacterium]|nr:hypothetical protein [Planctomycetaceae bacterium]
MSNDDPTDDDIRQADAVMLFDPNRDWKEHVGPLRPGKLSEDGTPIPESGYSISIPVDSTAYAQVNRWRERIKRLRDDLPTD